MDDEILQVQGVILFHERATQMTARQTCSVYYTYNTQYRQRKASYRTTFKFLMENVTIPRYTRGTYVYSEHSMYCML